MMEDYEAPSVAPDEHMASPEDAIMTLESEILQLVVQLGGSKQKYIKKFCAHEAARTQHTITEVYSPPRVTEWSKRLPGYGIVPGLALDLTTRDDNGIPWDFDLPERRAAARKLIAEQKPFFLVGSPLCTAFRRCTALDLTT